MRFQRASHSLPKFPNSQVAVACVLQNVHAFFGLQTTPVSLCGRLKYLFFDNPISVIGWTGIASCSPNKTFKSGRRVYAVRTHVVSAFQRTFVVPCLIAVTPTTKLNLLWFGNYTVQGRLKGRMGLSERTSAVQVAKTSVMMKRLDCITT